MLEKSFGLFFFLKQPKNQKNEERYVYLRITVDGTSKELSLKRSWQLDRWNQTAGRAIGNKEDARNLNTYLDSLSSKVYQAKLSLLDQNKSLTAENLKDVITGQDGAKFQFLEIFKVHNDRIEELVGKGYKFRTLQRYQTTYSHTKEFILWKFKREDINISELDYEFAEDFSFWLRTVKDCAHNTTMKYFASMKRIVLQCLLKKWIKVDPFLGFNAAQKEVEVIPLSKEELKSIESKIYDMERLNLVRDIFLFSCYTGLAYVDVKNLKRSQVIIGVDGGQWIFTKREKTETPSRIPMLEPALNLFEKYKDHPKCMLHNTVLPVLSNQKMNSYLKEIADTCQITKRLTFHIARHTFATTVTLSNGVPIETVSKMLGHKSIKQTQHYAKIVDMKISEDMMNLKNKLYPKDLISRGGI
jgi:integrase